MSSEEKSAQYRDLNANQRLLEIQAEIVEIEKSESMKKSQKKNTKK
ncbi:MAG: hypothetical protein R3B55_02880 [Candidatus Paceibacterota bacterium]